MNESTTIQLDTEFGYRCNLRDMLYRINEVQNEDFWSGNRVPAYQCDGNSRTLPASNEGVSYLIRLHRELEMK